MLFFLFLLLVCLTGCSKNIDTALTEKDLIAELSEHGQQYRLLREMITEDVKALQKFEVGEDRLGEYQLYDDGWAKRYDNYVPLEAILSEYSLTQSRHQEYLNLLSSAGASAIERYNGNVSIAISALGFVFGGCLSQIHYSPHKLELEKSSWAQVYHQAKFNDNWGGETKCN
ncbi:hypothetical protein ACU6U9_17500 [Pseudomonas sp. HK3]